MLTLELRVVIAVILSILGIARQFSCSLQTVRRYIRMQDSPAKARYFARYPRTGKLDPFKFYILERVQLPDPISIPASVMLSEIQLRGYSGGYSMLMAFLLQLKQQPNVPVVRFETHSGEQIQVDFTVTKHGRNPLLAFFATLAWSRASFVRFYPWQDSAVWCDGIEHALLVFGGTPKHLLFDNAKTIVLERDRLW